MLYNQGEASNKMLEEGFLLYCIIPCRDWIRTVFVFCEKLKSCINTQNTWWEPRYHSTFPEGYFPIHRNELHGNSALVLFPFIDILCLNIFFLPNIGNPALRTSLFWVHLEKPSRRRQAKASFPFLFLQKKRREQASIQSTESVELFGVAFRGLNMGEII